MSRPVLDTYESGVQPDGTMETTEFFEIREQLMRDEMKRISISLMLSKLTDDEIIKEYSRLKSRITQLNFMSLLSNESNQRQNVIIGEYLERVDINRALLKIMNKLIAQEKQESQDILKVINVFLNL